MRSIAIESIHHKNSPTSAGSSTTQAAANSPAEYSQNQPLALATHAQTAINTVAKQGRPIARRNNRGRTPAKVCAIGRPQAQSSNGLPRVPMATAYQLKKDGSSVKLGALRKTTNVTEKGLGISNKSPPKLGAIRPHPVGKITGKGTGTSDQVPINASNGEFIIKAAAVKIIGLETLEALNAISDRPDEKDSKAEKMAEYSDSESKKEDQGEGPEDAESKAEDKGEGPESAEGMKCGGKVKAMKCGGAVRKMAIGGLVTDEDRAKAVAQIPATGGTFPAPAPDGKDNTEAGRNIGNALSALPGAAPALGAIRSLAGASKVGTLLDAVGGSAGAIASKIAPYAVPAAGLGVVAAASQPDSVTSTPAATPALPGTPATQPAVTPAIDSSTPSPNVTVASRDGVFSFSGKNVSGDVTYDNKYNGTIHAGGIGGMISAQNNAAAAGLDPRYQGMKVDDLNKDGPVRGGGQVSSMDTSAGYAADQKQLADIAVSKADQNANMQAQADYAANKVLEGRALAGNRGALQIMSNNLRAKTDQRGQDVQAGATRANYQLALENQKLASAKDGREAASAGFQNRSAGRLEALYSAYESAKPEDRDGLANQIRVMTGKEPAAHWKTNVLQGIRNPDNSTSEGSMVATNELTGETRRLDQGMKVNTPVEGQVSTVNGKSAIFTKGVWVPNKV